MGFDNAAVARRYMQELWVKGNLDAVDELVDDSIELKEPMSPHGSRGKAAARDRVRELVETFSERDVVIQEIVVAGDRVAVRHTWRAKHTGTFMGLAPTNKYISCLSCEILRITNGKVVENITYYDQYEMFQQLGLLPSPQELVAAVAERASRPTRDLHRR